MSEIYIKTQESWNNIELDGIRFYIDIIIYDVLCPKPSAVFGYKTKCASKFHTTASNTGAWFNLGIILDSLAKDSYKCYCTGSVYI